MKLNTFSLLLFVASISLFILLSCSSDKPAENKNLPADLVATTLDMDNISWIEGKWGVGGGTSSQELWKRVNESLYQAIVFSMNGADTFKLEDIRLEKNEDGIVFFAPRVLNQNEGERIYYTLTSTNPNELIFENPEHDYPQKITYKRLGETFIKASIEGDQKGEFKKVIFPMERIIEE